jgi:8-oxo-dGTP diphosphatase
MAQSIRSAPLPSFYNKEDVRSVSKILFYGSPGLGARETMSKVRISAKAIIIQDGHLLVIRNRDSSGDWYSLPGGGQEHGETLTAALNRECLEEIGSGVTVGRIRFVRDYIAKNHEFAAEDDSHQVEVMFECQLTSAPGLGAKPDSMQTGVEWLELMDLSNHRLYPKALQRLLSGDAPVDGPLYLGDVN